MTIASTLALFLIMAILAAVPSASVALVVARSASLGVNNGAAVAAGIVVGDLIFVALALLGMSAAAAAFGTFFAVIKYLGGAYLIWMGIRLLRSQPTIKIARGEAGRSGLITSFSSGLALTLGDMKAIIFYASLFPNFVDLAQVGLLDACAIAMITVIAVGGVKLVYALTAHRVVARLRSSNYLGRPQKPAGYLLVGAGTYVITKA